MRQCEIVTQPRASSQHKLKPVCMTNSPQRTDSAVVPAVLVYSGGRLQLHQALGCAELPSFQCLLCFAAVEADLRNPEETVSIGEAYRQLWEVVKLPAVRRFAVVLVTFR